MKRVPKFTTKLRLLRNKQIRYGDAENFGLLVTFGAIIRHIGNQSAKIQGSQRDNSISQKSNYYKSHDILTEPLPCFIDSKNYARTLKALKGLTVFDYDKKRWEIDPSKFKSDHQHMIA